MKGLVENDEKDVRKVIKKYRDNFEEYVEDFCNPLFSKDHSTRTTFKSQLKSQLSHPSIAKMEKSKSDVPPEEMTRAEYMKKQREKRLEINKMSI